MSKYIIYFNQQWVGDHTSEWFQSRGPLARQVVSELKEKGSLVFAGGLVEEIEMASGMDENGAPKSLKHVVGHKKFVSSKNRLRTYIKNYWFERFEPKYQTMPATTWLEARAIAVFESSEAVNGAAAVTIPKRSPIRGAFFINACDFLPMRFAT